MYVCVCMYISLICERLYLLVRSEIYYFYLALRSRGTFTLYNLEVVKGCGGGEEYQVTILATGWNRCSALHK